MKNKIVFASGMALGYVLGTRAGRESYEKLKAKADQLWNNPKVQETVSDATHTLKEKAPEVQEHANDAFKKAQDGVSSTLHRGGKSDAGGSETGPSGGNPAKVEETPFQNQSPDTRPTEH